MPGGRNIGSRDSNTNINRETCLVFSELNVFQMHVLVLLIISAEMEGLIDLL